MIENLVGRYPYAGFGLGLRNKHFSYVLEHKPAVDWFEIISEDFLTDHAWPLEFIYQIREHYPLVMHGVSLSIGSTDPLDQAYLQKLKYRVDELQPLWVSDHLCWTGVNGINLHDLLPLPYTKATLSHVVERVLRVQDFLGRRLVLENVSSYITYRASEMTEWDFLAELLKRTDSLLLLDVNNIFVSGFNHGFDPAEYLAAIPVDRVQQIHLAGHTDNGDHLIDTHDADIRAVVWDWYRVAVRRFGRVSSMIERDGNIPEFSALYEEWLRMRAIAETLLQEVVV